MTRKHRIWSWVLLIGVAVILRIFLFAIDFPDGGAWFISFLVAASFWSLFAYLFRRNRTVDSLFPEEPADLHPDYEHKPIVPPRIRQFLPRRHVPVSWFVGAIALSVVFESFREIEVNGLTALGAALVIVTPIWLAANWWIGRSYGVPPAALKEKMEKLEEREESAKNAPPTGLTEKSDNPRKYLR